MRAIALILLLLAGCASQAPYDPVAERAHWKKVLDARIGMTEPELVRAMTRMPDASYQQDASTRMLRWTYDMSYTQRGTSPDYIYTRPTGIIPVGGTPDRQIVQACNVEWLLTDGKTVGYSLRGKGCP